MSATRESRLFRGSRMRIDMSPMIDLVFLLLIFFMVSSTLITYRKDPDVEPPIASASKVPKDVHGRIILNVLTTGVVRDEFGEELTLFEVENRMREAKSADPSTQLHLRADRMAAHDHVKKVIDASAKGGVTHVIFSTLATDK